LRRILLFVTASQNYHCWGIRGNKIALLSSVAFCESRPSEIPMGQKLSALAHQASHRAFVIRDTDETKKIKQTHLKLVLTSDPNAFYYFAPALLSLSNIHCTFCNPNTIECVLSKVRNGKKCVPHSCSQSANIVFLLFCFR
jgi:hypothetical protein